MTKFEFLINFIRFLISNPNHVNFKIAKTKTNEVLHKVMKILTKIACDCIIHHNAVLQIQGVAHQNENFEMAGN